MEELIKDIINRMRNTTTAPGYGGGEWRVAIGAHQDGTKVTWMAHLLSFNVSTGVYTLVQHGDAEPTCTAALQRLDRRVQLLRRASEARYVSGSAEVARLWERLNSCRGRYGDDAPATKAARAAWRRAVDKLASHDATGAPEKP